MFKAKKNHILLGGLIFLSGQVHAQVSILKPIEGSVLPDSVVLNGSCAGTSKVNLQNGTQTLKVNCSSSKWSVSISKSSLSTDANGKIKVVAKQDTYSDSKIYLSQPTPNTPQANSCNGQSVGLSKASTQAIDLSYGSDSLQKFDIFLPSTAATQYPLVILIHGGGFVGGDKSQYKNTGLSFAQKGIAAISLNYRFANAPLANEVEARQTEGALRSIKDGQRALQFIRCHSKELRVNPNKVVLFGSSAGASMSLWIGLQNDLANLSSKDPIERISTRVNGIVANSTQSSLDGAFFESDLFREYPNFSTDLLKSRAPRLYHLKAYDRAKFLNDPAIISYRQKVHFVDFMSSDDPEIWVSNSEPKADPADPANPDFGGIHHPNHVLALKKRGDQVGVKGSYSTPSVPEYNLVVSESSTDFVIRKLNEK